MATASGVRSICDQDRGAAPDDQRQRNGWIHADRWRPRTHRNQRDCGAAFRLREASGVLFGGTYDWNGRGIDDVEPVADVATRPGGSPERHFESIDIRQSTQYYRSRWGLTGSSDYQLSHNSNIHVRGLFSDFKNYGSRWVCSLTDNTQGIKLLDSNGCDTNDSGSPWHRAEELRPSTIRSAVPTSQLEISLPEAGIC